MYCADLHIHSTLSDGSQPVEEIVRLAARLGLTHLAFAEHDTTQGAREAVAAARAQGLHAVPAVEISAFLPSLGVKAHILGYAYRQNTHIEALCAPTLQKRHQNSLRQIDLLKRMGFSISREMVSALFCRPLYKQHIMDYLVKTGQADALFGETFRRLFGKGGPCAFSIDYADAADAVRAIAADGGYPVLAHPGQQKNLAAVPMLVKAGLFGIEQNHPFNTAADRAEIAALCREYGLIPTGGSDYHGRYGRAGSELGGHPAPAESRILFG